MLEGMNDPEITMYWLNKQTQAALDKADGTDRTAIKAAYTQALVDLNNIQTATLSTEASQIQAIKGMAGILEKLLRFMKDTIV